MNGNNGQGQGHVCPNALLERGFIEARMRLARHEKDRTVLDAGARLLSAQSAFENADRLVYLFQRATTPVLDRPWKEALARARIELVMERFTCAGEDLLSAAESWKKAVRR